VLIVVSCCVVLCRVVLCCVVLCVVWVAGGPRRRLSLKAQWVSTMQQSEEITKYSLGYMKMVLSYAFSTCTGPRFGQVLVDSMRLIRKFSGQLLFCTMLCDSPSLPPPLCSLTHGLSLCACDMCVAYIHASV
jgi:hypothetical protein